MWLGIHFGTLKVRVSFIFSGKPTIVRFGRYITWCPSIGVISKDGEVYTGHRTLYQRYLYPDSAESSDLITFNSWQDYFTTRHLFDASKLQSLLNVIRERAEEQSGVRVTSALFSISDKGLEEKDSLWLKQVAEKAGFEESIFISKRDLLIEYCNRVLPVKESKSNKGYYLLCGLGDFKTQVLLVKRSSYHWAHHDELEIQMGFESVVKRGVHFLMMQVKESVDQKCKNSLVFSKRMSLLLDSMFRSFLKQLDFFTNSSEYVSYSQKEISVSLNRTGLNELSSKYIQDVLELCRHLIKKNGLSTKSIERLLIVGDGAYKCVVDQFSVNKLGIPVFKIEEPKLAYTFDAALLANTLCRRFKWDKHVLKILNQYKESHGLYVRNDIPSRILDKHSASYDIPENEQVLGILDLSRFGALGARPSSVVFGQFNLYYRGTYENKYAKKILPYHKLAMKSVSNSIRKVEVSSNTIFDLEGSTLTGEMFIQMMRKILHRVDPDYFIAMRVNSEYGTY